MTMENKFTEPMPGDYGTATFLPWSEIQSF